MTVGVKENRSVLIMSGRERKARITAELNETLCRLRIVQRPGTLPFAMRDFTNLLKARYERLLERPSCAASCALVLGRPISDLAVLRHIRAGSAEDLGPAHVLHVRLPDGSLSADSEDIGTLSVNRFSKLFTSGYVAQDEAQFEDAVRAFSGALPSVPSHLLESLSAPVTSEELWEALKGTNDSAAPGRDGIPLASYKVLFPVLRTLLLRKINAFLEHGTRADSFRASRVILVPKQGGDPAEPSA